MGTISSGVGLISGLNIADIVSKLMAIERRPVDQLQARLKEVQTQRAAYLELSARLLAVKSAAASFDESDFFRLSQATSSDDSVMSATAAADTPVGSYAFRVQSVVSNHQIIATGVPDRDKTPVGAGTMTIELGRSELNPATSLAVLNDLAGVQRGVIRITDRSGRSADVDLSTALTVDDVLNAINTQTGASVQASVQDRHIVLTDRSGGTGALSVIDLGGRTTATDLGIAGSISGNALTGRDVLALSQKTSLNVLNDGNGVRRGRALDDFSITAQDGTVLNVNLSNSIRLQTRLETLNNGGGVRGDENGDVSFKITNRAGETATISFNLADVQTVGDIVDRISGAGEDLGVTAALVNSSILLTDSSVPAGQTAASDLIIEDVTGFAARDLGIAGAVSTNSVRGSAIYSVSTIGDVLRAINYASVAGGGYNDGRIEARIAADGTRLELVDTTTGSGATTVAALNGSGAAKDLGLATFRSTDGNTASGQRILAGLNTVLLRSLNGGAGVGTGTIEITNSAGVTQVDLSGAETVQQVLDAINATTADSDVQAGLTSSGLGIVIKDLSGGSSISIADVDGTVAAGLKLAATSARGEVSSGNLQFQYINEGTALSALNGGQGIRYGSFKITNSAGLTRSFTLTSSLDLTVGDVIKRINDDTTLSVTARVNDTGDGILLEDTAGGDKQLTVTESGGTTAADLRLLGTAAKGQTKLDGSYETVISIDADDTLNDVKDKISKSLASVSASIINDGSSLNPYRLTLASKVSGTPGRILVDSGGTGLDFATLVEAKDAVVFFGSANSSESIPIISSTNEITGIVEGLTLNVNSVSDKPVTISVGRNVDQMVTSVKTFVKAFNDVLGRIDDLTAYNATTDERGTLFGESAVQQLESRLYQAISTPVSGAPAGYTRLLSVGLTIGSGATLQFDETKFRAAYAADPAAVEALFTQEVPSVAADGTTTTKKVGFGYRIAQVLEDLTQQQTGFLAQQDARLQSRVDLYNDRISYMEGLLTRKQSQLEAQFQAMEQALAMLQDQQSALSSLTSIAAAASSKA